LEPRIVQKNVAYNIEEQAWGVFAIGGIKKPQFNSKDYGSASFIVARPQLTDKAAT
jgi:hypothetical protein